MNIINEYIYMHTYINMPLLWKFHITVILFNIALCVLLLLFFFCSTQDGAQAFAQVRQVVNMNTSLWYQIFLLANFKEGLLRIYSDLFHNFFTIGQWRWLVIIIKKMTWIPDALNTSL